VFTASRTTKKSFAVGVAILGWAVLLFFAVLLLANLVQYARISMNPQSALGVVQEKTAEEDRGEGLSDRWVLGYSFTAASGLDYQGRAGVGRSFYYSVEVKDQLEVEYAADDPGNNRLRGELDPDVVVTLLLIVLDACLFVLAALRLLVQRVVRRARSNRSRHA
jgi:hypothetical protein